MRGRSIFEERILTTPFSVDEASFVDVADMS
jgi:hypothetical protein